MATPPPHISAQKDCGNCGAAEGSVYGISKHKVCTRCKATFYCSRSCQTNHWKEHKAECAELEAGRGLPLSPPAFDPGDACFFCSVELTKGPATTLDCAHCSLHTRCLKKLGDHGVAQPCSTCRGTASEAASAQVRFDGDMTRALQMYLDAAAKGWKGGLLPEEGQGELGDLYASLRDLATSDGVAVAARHLGTAYQIGLGVDKSDTEAFAWLRCGAELGDTLSMLRVASMLEHGEGTPKGPEEAWDWCMKATEAENVEGGQACNNLGLIYEQGLGVDRDLEAAAGWYRKGALKGHAEAMFNLSRCCYEGIGVEASEEEEVAWLVKAAEGGYPDAMHNLATKYIHGRGGLTKSSSKSTRWYRRAAEQGFAESQFVMGGLYVQGGCGLPSIPGEYSKWIKRAAGQGHRKASAVLPMLDSLANVPIEFFSPESSEAMYRSLGPEERARSDEIAFGPKVVVGARVEVTGLNAKPELNGAFGTVTAFHNENDGTGQPPRCSVLMDGNAGTFRIKPQNLAARPTQIPDTD